MNKNIQRNKNNNNNLIIIYNRFQDSDKKKVI